MKMNTKPFFKFGFIVLLFFIIFDCVMGLTVFFLDNPFNLSFHSEFYVGLLLGLTFFSTAYIGYLKND